MRLLLPFFSIPLIVFYSACSSADLLSEYEKFISKEKSFYTTIQKNYQNGLRTGCEARPSNNLSSCFRYHLKNITMRSSVAVVTMLATATAAATYDKHHGQDELTSRLLLLDNTLAVLEAVRPAQFYLASLQPGSADDRKACQDMKDLDVSLLNKMVKENIFKDIDGVLKKVQVGVQPLLNNSPSSALGQWQLTVYKSVEARYAPAKMRSFKFP